LYQPEDSGRKAAEIACPQLLPAGAGPAARVNGPKAGWLFSHRHPALGYRWSMMFSENRYPLFGIML
jgi:hypothetical protein